MTTILVVEDSIEILENVAELLSLCGYETLQAHDGLQGIAVVEQNAVDLILSDIRMPEMDGWALLEALRRNPASEHIPIAFFTAKADEDSIERAKKAGVEGYIIKPFNNDDLLVLVEAMLTSVSKRLH